MRFSFVFFLAILALFFTAASAQTFSTRQGDSFTVDVSVEKTTIFVGAPITFRITITNYSQREIFVRTGPAVLENDIIAGTFLAARGFGSEAVKHFADGFSFNCLVAPGQTIFLRRMANSQKLFSESDEYSVNMMAGLYAGRIGASVSKLNKLTFQTNFSVQSAGPKDIDDFVEEMSTILLSEPDPAEFDFKDYVGQIVRYLDQLKSSNKQRIVLQALEELSAMPIPSSKSQTAMLEVRLTTVGELNDDWSPEFLVVFEKFLDSENQRVRSYCLSRLGNFDSEISRDVFFRAARSKFWEIRLEAVEYMGSNVSDKSVELLTELAQDPVETVRRAAVQAIKNIERTRKQ